VAGLNRISRYKRHAQNRRIIIIYPEIEAVGTVPKFHRKIVERKLRQFKNKQNGQYNNKVKCKFPNQ